MKQDVLTKKLVIALLAFVCCLLWGSAVPMIKTGYRILQVESQDYATQVLFAGMRFFLSGFLVVLFACVRSKKILYPDKQTIKLASVLCLAQTVGQYFFFYIGVANATGVKSGILSGMGNFFAIIVACLVFRSEKISKRKFFGCLFGFLGILLINLGGGPLDAGWRLTGEGFILVSQFSYAISTVLINLFSKKASPVLLSGYQFMFGGAILAVLGIVLGGHLEGFTPVAGLVLLYLAMLSAVAYTLWSVLLAHNPVSEVAIYGFITPICSVILSAVILGEYAQAFNKNNLLALCMVCIGIYIVNAVKKK